MKKKLNLTDLKVNSFVTANLNAIRAGEALVKRSEVSACPCKKTTAAE